MRVLVWVSLFPSLARLSAVYYHLYRKEMVSTLRPLCASQLTMQVRWSGHLDLCWRLIAGAEKRSELLGRKLVSETCKFLHQYELMQLLKL